MAYLFRERSKIVLIQNLHPYILWAQETSLRFKGKCVHSLSMELDQSDLQNRASFVWSLPLQLSMSHSSSGTLILYLLQDVSS
jgi:hypothetical protein